MLNSVPVVAQLADSFPWSFLKWQARPWGMIEISSVCQCGCDDISGDDMSHVLWWNVMWQNVRETKCPCDEMFVWRNTRLIFVWPNVRVTNSPCEEISGDEMSVWRNVSVIKCSYDEMFMWQNVRETKRTWDEMSAWRNVHVNLDQQDLLYKNNMCQALWHCRIVSDTTVFSDSLFKDFHAILSGDILSSDILSCGIFPVTFFCDIFSSDIFPVVFCPVTFSPVTFCLVTFCLGTFFLCDY